VRRELVGACRAVGRHRGVTDDRGHARHLDEQRVLRRANVLARAVLAPRALAGVERLAALVGGLFRRDSDVQPLEPTREVRELERIDLVLVDAIVHVRVDQANDGRVPTESAASRERTAPQLAVRDRGLDVGVPRLPVDHDHAALVVDTEYVGRREDVERSRRSIVAIGGIRSEEARRAVRDVVGELHLDAGIRGHERRAPRR
jgi:hypothetical protein